MIAKKRGEEKHTIDIENSKGRRNGTLGKGKKGVNGESSK